MSTQISCNFSHLKRKKSWAHLLLHHFSNPPNGKLKRAIYVSYPYLLSSQPLSSQSKMAFAPDTTANPFSQDYDLKMLNMIFNFQSSSHMMSNLTKVKHFLWATLLLYLASMTPLSSGFLILPDVLSQTPMLLLPQVHNLNTFKYPGLSSFLSTQIFIMFSYSLTALLECSFNTAEIF